MKRKISQAQRLEIVEKYISDGKTYREIADEYGVSLSLIAGIVGRATQREPRRKSGLHFTESTVELQYPALEKWREQHDLTQGEMARVCGMDMVTYRAIAYKRDYIHRHARLGPSKRMIDSILRGTGMTYEEAFGIDDYED